jgi:hypothetical protein
MLAFAGTAQASTAGSSTTTSTGTTNGGAGMSAPASTPSTPVHPTVPGFRARIIQGVAYAPAAAPIQVQRIIWAGNQIRHKPYIYGGGHGVWNDAGYDCSGSVSYVLHAAGLIHTSMDSTEFESWGLTGTGQWVTVYANSAHAFLQVAGIRLDTSAEGDRHPAPGSGPRWRPLLRHNAGFEARHPSAVL